MNANSLPKTPVINQWLTDATRQLSTAGIPSARLDAEIILAHAINKNRAYLHSYPELSLEKNGLKSVNSLLKLRIERMPIAYITGKKGFYGRKFIVTPDTLIPRPESEDIITALKRILPSSTYQLPLIKLVDIGTGSGCLGITAKLEYPNLDVTLSDISDSALGISKKNAEMLSANVRIIKSDLLQNYDEMPDIIFANLPYVDTAWPRSPETIYEPSLALFAKNNGLAIIKKLIAQSSDSLATNGFLIIESDPIQHKSLIVFANKYGLTKTDEFNYTITFAKKVAC